MAEDEEIDPEVSPVFQDGMVENGHKRFKLF